MPFSVDETTMPLHRLGRGQVGVVEHVCGSSDDCARLASMGLCCGALIQMLVPGAPCAVQVGETRLMLRGDHCDAIKVAPLT